MAPKRPLQFFFATEKVGGYFRNASWAPHF